MRLRTSTKRIMRRAYMPYRSRIRSRVVKNYHEVLGMIIAVRRELGVYDISQLLGITEDEVYSTLKPIGSIVNIPSGNTKYINFYHGTAREFITGDPIGEEEDKVFFISDTEGHFLGPRLLRIVNDVIKRNEFGVPTKPPLGDEKKWQHSLSRARPNHIKYAFEHVFNHLDRSLLISQDPNELQREFEEFLARNLFSLFSTVHRTYFYRRSDWDQGDNHRITELMREVHELFDDSACVYEITPWHFYRSSLPFIPSSSLIFEWYGHLSDPIHVFSISGDFAGRLIPLSDDALQAQEAMRARQRELPTSLDEQGRKTLVINYRDEFLDNDVRNGTVTCAALSRDGRHIALGFGSGVIEVADIDDQCTVSRFRGDPLSLPAWIEFVQGRTVCIATEDTDGNISILGHSTRLVRLGPLPSDPYPAVTAVSDNGSFVLRVPRNPEKGCVSVHSFRSFYCSASSTSLQVVLSFAPHDWILSYRSICRRLR
ncbi:uncharacterized protein EI90DRAFT_1335606 [Cantharellus anzutake]|uniref:uncharacterized protein n=1 Tax=Cantharellus anzutake TaxID=1750568 RepID=UPI001905913D|nr:uncharacterized protein EI90DRAFT_1335606 [Cantharellus anzutake]KAF8329697.1 hypothetical protein EI90DRAFT_1335606 [Cantharellus anzutake]